MSEIVCADIFELGNLYVTPGVIEKIKPVEVFQSIDRHRVGDWGVVVEDDRLANEEALLHGLRIFSVYYDSKETKFWINCLKQLNSFTNIKLKKASK